MQGLVRRVEYHALVHHQRSPRPSDGVAVAGLGRLLLFGRRVSLGGNHIALDLSSPTQDQVTVSLGLARGDNLKGLSDDARGALGDKLVDNLAATFPIPGDEHGDVEYAITRTEWEARRGASPG